MAFMMMPRIIATETEVIDMETSPLPKEKTSPPMPATRMTELTKMFLVFDISTFSWMRSPG